MTTAGYRRDSDSHLALYSRVVAALERSAELAEQHAQRQLRNGRLRDAADELERARRSRQLATRARALLRLSAQSTSSGNAHNDSLHSRGELRMD